MSASSDPGPPTVWRPRHPDPALTEPARPGLHAHRFPPDRLHTFVFLQHQVWVDFYGNEVEIESMSRDYAAAVVAFCQMQAARIRRLVVFVRLVDQIVAVCAGVYPDERVLDECEAATLIAPAEWLEQTPLIRALRRRLERL